MSDAQASVNLASDAKDWGSRGSNARARAEAARQRAARARERRLNRSSRPRAQRQRLDAAGRDLSFACTSLNDGITDSWCTKNCNMELPNCPTGVCTCVPSKKVLISVGESKSGSEQLAGPEPSPVASSKRKSAARHILPSPSPSPSIDWSKWDDNIETEYCSGSKCWPAVYLIGAQKAATTSVSWALSGLLCMATWRPDSNNADFLQPPASFGRKAVGPLDVKVCPEVHAFDAGAEKFEWVARNTSRYTGLFHPRAGRGREGTPCPRRIFMDATPTMFHWLAAQRMRSIIPGRISGSVRLIAILREPIARDLSHFNHVKQEDTGPGGSSNFAGLCDVSSYAANVACELDKWRECVAAVGLTNQNGTYEQYASCPGWDQVMMGSKVVYDEDKRLSRIGRHAARKHPMSMSLLAQSSGGQWANGDNKRGHNLLLSKGMGAPPPRPPPLQLQLQPQLQLLPLH